MGALVEPLTKQSFEDGTGRLPPEPFAHNTMQRSAFTVDAGATYAKGMLGRMAESFVADSTPPFKSALYSIQGYSKMLENAEIAPYIIDGDRGVMRFNEYAALADEIAELSQFESGSVFAETYQRMLDLTLRTTEELGSGLANASIASLDATFPTTQLGNQLAQVARVMKLDRSATGGRVGPERAGFFTQHDGYDTHDKMDISANLGEVEAALRAFVTELKTQGAWDDVTVVVASEFGRTIDSNGQGTDHGWGGNYFVLGGQVNGGQMLGQYPTTLAESATSLNVGRGRLIPTTPWEAVWLPVAEWWGVDVANATVRNKVLPHAKNFPSQLFTRQQLFR